MPFITFRLTSHDVLTGVSAADHHAATVASDLNLADMAERDHVSLQNLASTQHAPVVSQAEMEGETGVNRTFTPALLRHTPGIAKCWLRYDQLTTPVLEASYNITSVTDNSEGDFTPVIADDFSAATYAVIAQGHDPDNIAFDQAIVISSQAVGSYICDTLTVGSNADYENGHAAFGDQ